MPRNIPSQLLVTLLKKTFTTCLAWKVVLQDGTVMGFTDHDVDLTFGGMTFAKMSGFTASAIEDQLGLAVSNMDVMGALSSDAITESDLEKGRYDEAEIIVYIVNWLNPDVENAALVKGTLGKVQIGDLAFQAELRSLGQHYQQYIGSLCTPKCRVPNLGDTGTGLEGGCNFTMPAPVAGTITSVTSRTSFTVSAAGSFPDGAKGSLSGGYFAFGTCKFSSGTNINVVREISTSNPALEIVTREPFPLDIAVGDTVALQIGCDMTPEVCRINYNNIVNFRGEPYVPGSDMVFRVNSENIFN